MRNFETNYLMCVQIITVTAGEISETINRHNNIFVLKPAAVNSLKVEVDVPQSVREQI